MDQIYYLITFICTAGGCYTGTILGRREGIVRILSFLEHHSKENGIVKLRIRGEDFEFVD